VSVADERDLLIRLASKQAGSITGDTPERDQKAVLAMQDPTNTWKFLLKKRNPADVHF
jgi:hypothetical protein